MPWKKSLCGDSGMMDPEKKIHGIAIRPSKLYSVSNAVLDFANRRVNGMVKRYMEQQIRSQRESVDFPAKHKRRVHIHKQIYQDRPIYTIFPKGNMDQDKVMIFLHGGGGIMPPTALHFNMAVKLSKRVGCPLYFVMYPRAPKANAKEAVKWLKAWYRHIIQESRSRKYYIIGDSAGANLSAALCSGGVEEMKGVILISPVPRIDEIEKYMSKYEEHDILLSMNLLKNIAACWGKNMDMKDSDINISFVDFSRFPKTMLIYGGREIFAGAIEELVEKMRGAGIDLAVYNGEIHCHDWVLASAFPESKRMLSEICNFIT